MGSPQAVRLLDTIPAMVNSEIKSDGLSADFGSAWAERKPAAACLGFAASTGLISFNGPIFNIPPPAMLQAAAL